MPRIKVLSENVANMIAAGEVINRPASAVKELVENALDAGATRITVRLVAAGRRMIEVADNGHGMSEQDAVLAVERHATSKIRKADDLDATLKSPRRTCPWGRVKYAGPVANSSI